MSSGLVAALRTPEDLAAAEALLRRLEAQMRVGVPISISMEIGKFIASLEERERERERLSAQRVAVLTSAAKSRRRSVLRYMKDIDVRLFVGVGDTPSGLQRLAAERHGVTLTDEEAQERVRYDGIHAYYRLRREHEDAPLTFLDSQVWGYELRKIQCDLSQYLRGARWGAKAELARRAGVSDNYIGRILDPGAQSMNLGAADRIRTALSDLGYMS